MNLVSLQLGINEPEWLEYFKMVFLEISKYNTYVITQIAWDLTDVCACVCVCVCVCVRVCVSDIHECPNCLYLALLAVNKKLLGCKLPHD